MKRTTSTMERENLDNQSSNDSDSEGDSSSSQYSTAKTLTPKATQGDASDASSVHVNLC